MRLSHSIIGASLALCAFGGGAAAQDETKPPATEFNVDVGYVSVAGNTSLSSFNVNERIIRRFAPWEIRQDLGSVYARTDGAESSNLWRASLRADYGLTPLWALYALTAFDRDKFAGVKSRFAEGAGAVARLIATNIDQLNVEAGLQVTQQRDFNGTSDNFTSARAATSWKHVLLESAYFFQSAEVLPNLEESDDLRVNTETAIVAPLSAVVGLKVSYVVRYDNLPALSTAGSPLRKTDRILSSGIQISF